jgi:hypothetical protein
MNKVKDWKSIKILGAVALFAVVLAVASVPATAQTVQSNAVVNTAPIGAGDDLLGNVATGVITTNAVGYDIRGHATVATQITTFGLGAGATNSLVVLTQTSNNKTNWQTLATTTLIAAGASDAGTIVTSLVSYWQAGPESDARKTGIIGERENLMPYKTQKLNNRTDIVGFAQTPSASAVAGRIPDVAEKAAGIPFPGIRDVLIEPETNLTFLNTLFVQPDGSSASQRVEAIFCGGAGQVNAGLLILQ